MFRKHKRNRYKFTEKRHSIKGIIASSTGAISLLVLGLFIWQAYKNGGTVSTYYGAGGVAAFLLSFVGIVLAIQDSKNDRVFRFFSSLGIILEVLSIAGWGGILFMGIR